ADLSASARIKFFDVNTAREQRTPEGFDRAIQLLQQILEQHPSHAVTKARLAEVYVLRNLHAVVPAQPDFALAYALAQDALCAFPRLWEAHIALGAIYACRDWNWRKADKCFKAALEIAPAKTKLQPSYLMFLVAQNRVSESIEHLEHVLGDFDDLSLLIRRNLGLCLMLAGDYTKARSHLEAVIQSTPSHHLSHFFLGTVYNAVGEHDKALTQMEHGLKHPGSEYMLLGSYVFTLAKCGQRRKALQNFQEMKRRSHYSSIHLAIASVGLEQYEHALDWIKKACEDREFQVLILPHWPVFKPLHSFPRFQATLRNMNLSPSH
ncbi:MAG TPA: tetratricopeptide repeat protein, partial [Candidatus Angelobacter sp.]